MAVCRSVVLFHLTARSHLAHEEHTREEDDQDETTLREETAGLGEDFRQERRDAMDKVLVVVFESESKAYEGSRALQALQDEGSINLYAKAVIARDAGGKVEVKQAGDMGPVGTAVGLLTGSLIGLIGGPVGLAVGAGAGMFGGLLYDSAHLGVGEDFVAEAAKSLQPGKAALVAEVWEEWTLPVDTRMEDLGGVVLRRTRNEAFNDLIQADAAALDADLLELEAETNQATGEAKVKLQKRVVATKAKLQAMQDAIQARIDASRQETDAKVKSLEEQAAKARGERKAKIEKRIAELKADQKRNNDRLKQAWEHAKQALSD